MLMEAWRGLHYCVSCHPLGQGRGMLQGVPMKTAKSCIQIFLCWGMSVGLYTLHVLIEELHWRRGAAGRSWEQVDFSFLLVWSWYATNKWTSEHLLRECFECSKLIGVFMDERLGTILLIFMDSHLLLIFRKCVYHYSRNQWSAFGTFERHPTI